MKKISQQFIAIIISGIILLMSCNGNRTNEKTTITIIGENTANIQSLMTLKEDYESSHSSIDLVFKPETFDDAFQKTNSDFQNKTGIYDIVMQYNFSLSTFVRNDYVYTLQDLLKNKHNPDTSFEKDIFPDTWKSVGYYYNSDNHDSIVKVGYPFAANTMLLMYNKQMFEDSANKAAFQKKYGTPLSMPTTWVEFQYLANFFTNREKGTYGVCLEGAAGGFLYYEWLNYLNGQGGRVLDKHYGWEGDSNTKVLLNSASAVDALTYFTGLKPFNNGNFTDVEQFKKLTLMKEGKTAMAFAWDDVIVSSLKSATGFDNRFGFSPIPGDHSFIGGGAFFISKQSKHPGEAMDFILYAMQKANQVKLARNGLSSPLISTYEDSIVASYPHSLALKHSLMRGGIYPEAGPDSKMIDEVLTNYVQKTWSGVYKPAKAIELATDEIITNRKTIFEAIKEK